MDLRRIGWLVGTLLAATVAGGCSDDGTGAAGTDGSTSGTATSMPTTAPLTTDSADSSGTSIGDPTVTTGESTTISDPTTGPSTDSSDDGTTGELPPFDAMCDEGTSTGGSSDSGSSDSGSTDSGGGLPNGSACTDDVECGSMHCFVAGVLGGICGECTTDDHCPGGGCTIPNPLTSVGSVCNDGEQGGGCESNNACCGIGVCAVVLNVPGVITTSTCGQCVDDGDCGGPGLCQPDLDVVNITGILECVAPGSLPDGHSCTQDATGDTACASGHCTTASLMGLVNLGVCSECDVDDDCAAGETCAPPEVDTVLGLLPGQCV